MIKSFMRVWNADFTFRAITVMGLIFLIDIRDGKINLLLAWAYYTTVIYSFAKTLLNFRALKNFRKRQDKLRARFDAAMDSQDMEEASKVLVLLTKSAHEFFGPDEEKEKQ